MRAGSSVRLVLGAAVLALGIGGPSWPEDVRIVLLLAAFAVGFAGMALLVGGVSALGTSITPFPKPTEGATLKVHGAYRWARHPIYGGVVLLGLAWSLASSPLALAPAALLESLLELKSLREEMMLVERHPGYDAYRRAVRWRFVPGIR